jgi:nitroimidazol reductase NimA-like FMN-containing flavoprotein (pyridoxamine 5'-phosphate oxidase superfamily)
MLIDEGLELLEEHEAFGLLSAGEIGRIGLNVGGVPAIFPVNYRVIDGAVVIRTSPGTKLSAAAAGAIVAFEVDEVDLERREGWSVLVVGQAEVLHGLRPTLDVIESGLEPFVDGPRHAMIRITPASISGRRIIHDPDWATL